MSEAIILHGVFLEILGVGVLLEGPSGVGKSALALELINRGHKLIADDAPEFSCCSSATIQGSCPQLLQDFLEVYGLGVLNISAMFGTEAVAASAQLQLLITLLNAAQFQPAGEEYLHGCREQRTLLGVELPVVKLPVIPERDMATMVECVVRNHILRTGGYDSSGVFASRQRSIAGEKR